jgi:O-antigen ligase
MSENVMQAAAARRWREENPGTTPPSRLVEPDRDHLHSNPVQVLSATGFPGLAIYLLWMLVMVIRAVATAWTVRRRDRRKGVLMVALALMIISVLLNGLVEYNFGDTELLIVLGSLMGVTGGLRRGIGS